MWVPTYRKFRDTLTSMCRITSPHGCEPYVWPHLPSPPSGGAPGTRDAYEYGGTEIDKDGNYIVTIPGKGVDILWTSHCDTADSYPTIVNMKWNGDMLKTDGKTILGADDKVGCAIMAMMIRAGCPGTYAFFAGEEVGCVGSSAYASKTRLLQYDACISLDRKGYDSVITHQCGTRCCSDAWGTELAKLLSDASDGYIDMSVDSTGVFTDSREFINLVPECTNLSVGYFMQHTPSEHTNVMFAYQLCCALIKIVCGDGIPTPQRDVTTDDDDDTESYGSLTRWLAKRNKSIDKDMMSDEDWRNML